MTMGAAALELYVSENVRSALLDEIRRRREQLHDGLTLSLESKLVTTDSGLYASLVLPGGYSTVKVASALALDGLHVTPSESIGLDRPRHDSIPFIRLCLGGHEDFGEVAEILNANESILIQSHG
jgi:DNA-binding transcriptional MocR family regulator